MELTQPVPKPGAWHIWIGLGIFAVTTLASALVVRERPLTQSATMLSTVFSALGVLGMAAVMARSTPYPRWAHWTSAMIFAGWVLASPWIAGSVEAWSKDARSSLWLMPWFVMVTATATPRRAQGVCATQGARAGYLLIAMSLVIGGVLMFAERIANFLMSLGRPTA